jgi:arylsulfatase
LAPLLTGEWRARLGPHEWLGFELAGDRAVRKGPWKLVWMPPPFGAEKWRLFRLDRDPAELWDRSDGKPEQRKALLAIWEEYAKANGIVLPEVEGEDEAVARRP